MSSGFGEGEYRVEEAFKNALHSPLLNNNDIFAAKKVLFNIYYSEENPLIVEEMDAVSEFMKKFGAEVEVIWGTAAEEGLGEQVKITLLATGFGMSSIPGIGEHERILTEEEELLEEERLAKEAEEIRRLNALIEEHYGKDGVKTMSTSGYFTPKPIILSSEDLDNDRVIEAMENTPLMQRGENFNPHEFRPETRKSSDLFNE